jgi:hypothetical protein
MLWVGRDARIPSEQGFYLPERNSMLSALRPVAIIPIETADLKVHHSTILGKCIYISSSLLLRASLPRLNLFGAIVKDPQFSGCERYFHRVFFRG